MSLLILFFPGSWSLRFNTFFSRFALYLYQHRSQYNKMTHNSRFILCFTLVLSSVYAGPQQHGAWKDSAGLGGMLGSATGGLAAGAWGGPVGAAVGFGVGIITFIVGGPATSVVRCFEPNTVIATPKGQVVISKLKENDLVFTHENQLSKVLAIHQSQGVHEFVTIHTNVGFLEVTSDHIMIVNQKLIQAQNLKVGMKLGTEEIIKLEKTHKLSKISLFTSDGSVMANGIPTTIICAEYEGLSVAEGLERWKKEHKQLYPQLMSD